MRLQPRVLLVILFAVFLRSSAGGQQPSQMVILLPRAVASDPSLPAVRVTVDHQRVQLGTLVNFIMSPASLASDRRYTVTLNFGDGQRCVMNQPAMEHLYGSVGRYVYSVSVTRKPPQVELNVSGVPAQENELVKFTAQLSVPDPDLQYRFVYGDGSRTDWQSSPNVEHAYNHAGNYSAYVEVGDGNQGLGGSTRKQITIGSSPSASQRAQVSLSGAPLPVRKGQPVVFSASVIPAIANAKYQFDFGDGTSTLWQVNPQAQHIYDTSGTHNAFVQVSQSGANPNALKSNIIAVSVQPIQTPNPNPSPTPDQSASPTPAPSPAPSPSPTPSPSASVVDSPTAGVGSASPTTSTTGSDGNNPSVAPGSIRWWYWLLLGVLLLGLFKATAYLFAAKPTFAAFSDPGVAGITNQKGLLPLDFQMVLRPNVSTGNYSVTTGEPQLIQNLDRLQNRQVLEI